MTVESYALLPLLYALLGGVLALSGDIWREFLRRRREARILVGRLLADLVELRDREQATRLLITQLQVAAPEQVVLRQIMDVVIPGLEALAQRYDQAVTQLAGLSPFLAVRLRAHGSVPLALSRLRGLVVTDQTVVSVWAQIETMVDSARGARLDELILELAGRHGWSTGREVRQQLQREPGVPPEIAQLLNLLKQQVPRPNPPASAGTQ